MKKLLNCMISFVLFLFLFASKVEAAGYEGDLGYSYSPTSTSFYLFVEDENVEKVEIYIDGLDAVTMSKQDNIYRYIHTASDLKNLEYYYNVCYIDTTCKEIIDPFALTINDDGTRNIVIDIESISSSKWEYVTPITPTMYNNSIYAIEADKFVESLDVVPQEERVITDSVFSKLSEKTVLKNQSEETKDIYTGYHYITKTGIRYLEVGNLYDENNYFFPNTKYASDLSMYSAIEEYQNFVSKYHSAGINVIARMDILSPNEILKYNFSVLSDEYIVNGKLNLSNPQIQRYVMEVYQHWASVYKVAGFYITNAEEYGETFYSSLVSQLRSLDQGNQLFIYNDSTNLGTYRTSDELQNSLYGSLLDNSNIGVINGEFSEESFMKLVNAMFSGNYSNISNYRYSNYVINNFGSLEGLDVYSKIKIVSGMTSKTSAINDKVKMALQIIFSSAGIPRVVAGNEFYNNNPVNEFGEDFDDISKVCIEGSSFCYAIGEDKKIEWIYSRDKSYQLSNMSNYRQKYFYQFPSVDAMANLESFDYNKELINKGVLYFTFNYKAAKTGQVKKSIILINFSNEDVELESISNFDYSKVSSLVGKVEAGKEKTIVKGFTFFTFSEIKGSNIPQWVYLLVCIGLVFLIFGIRSILIKLLKEKRGIDYKEYAYEQKKGKKRKNNKKKENSILREYLGNEPIFKRKNKNKKNTEEQAEKNNEEIKEKEADNKSEEK